MLLSIPILITLALAEVFFGVTPQERKALEAKGRAEYIRTMGH